VLVLRVLSSPVLKWSAFAVFATASTFVIGGYLLGFGINDTPSVSTGSYIRSFSAIRPGRYVSFCSDRPQPFLPKGKGCPFGLRPLLKRVAGMPGDLIEVTDHYVSVNGVRLPNSAPKPVDRFGNALPVIRGVFTSTGYFVVGDDPSSYDSRYYGAVPVDKVSGPYRRVWR
jgi:conjugative transfer signal peptidase TraF